MGNGMGKVVSTEASHLPDRLYCLQAMENSRSATSDDPTPETPLLQEYIEKDITVHTGFAWL